MEFWGDLFSGQYALQWDAARTNDTLSVPFSVAKAGRYKITARLARVEAGGTFALQVDDLKITEPVSLYKSPPFPEPFDKVAAEGEFTEGAHVLKFTSLAPDQRAKGNRLLLDKIQLTGAER